MNRIAHLQRMREKERMENERSTNWFLILTREETWLENWSNCKRELKEWIYVLKQKTKFFDTDKLKIETFLLFTNFWRVKKLHQTCFKMTSFFAFLQSVKKILHTFVKFKLDFSFFGSLRKWSLISVDINLLFIKIESLFSQTFKLNHILLLFYKR